MGMWEFAERDEWTLPKLRKALDLVRDCKDVFGEECFDEDMVYALKREIEEREAEIAERKAKKEAKKKGKQND